MLYITSYSKTYLIDDDNNKTLKKLNCILQRKTGLKVQFRD